MGTRRLAAAVTCVVLALPAAARADEVRITDPAGGTYRNGQVLTVKWDYAFLEQYPKTAAEKTMEIYMRNYDTSMWVGRMATVDVLSRGYTWSIKNIPPGRYMLYFSKPSEPLRGTCAVSEIFTIEAGSSRFYAFPVAALSSIRITSPVGGKVYYIDSTMPIRWDTSRIAGEKTIWLQICWPDGKPAAGAFPAPNTGSYDWLIKETAENSLRVCITTMDEKTKGTSGTFEIKFRPKLKRVMPGPMRTIRK